MSVALLGGPTATDFFCGAGGSSSGLRNAGYTIKVAANHWDRAIETHAANHPDTEHLCADISAVDVRYLPKTDILWASPICTELSQAGGRRRKGHTADLFEEHGHVPSAAFERTRVTFWEILRAAEVHRYSAILIENVVEAGSWELFDVFLAGLTALGYNYQFVSVSAAHVGDDEGNERAPQWRDRMYIVCTRVGITLPDVDPRPLAWCPTCDGQVQAVQAWKKPGRRIGKYRQQYVYICPEVRCAGQQVEPYVLPAAAAIDWTDLGTRIGDMPIKEHKDKATGKITKGPLAPATMRRIRVGLETIGNPALVAAAGNTFERAHGRYTRAWPALEAPMNVRTGTIAEGLASADPFLAMLRNHGGAESVNAAPAAVFTGGGYHHGLTIPPGAFISKHHGNEQYKAIGHMNKPVDTDPMPTLVAAINNSLVIPYRKGSTPHRAAGNAFSTMSTVDTHTLVGAAVDVEDCYFRMCKPEESALAQRFERDYVWFGNKGERQMQAGNAVAGNVAQWLGASVAQVL